jgi:hypothetical protein
MVKLRTNRCIICRSPQVIINGFLGINVMFFGKFTPKADF